MKTTAPKLHVDKQGQKSRLTDFVSVQKPYLAIDKETVIR